MIAFAAALLAILQSPAAVPPVPPELEAYYFCVANGVDALVEDDRDAARPAEQIVGLATASCVHLRRPAMEAAIRLMRADPRVEEWARQRNMTEEEVRRETEVEFDGALRQRLLLNIAELRAGRAGN